MNDSSQKPSKVETFGVEMYQKLVNAEASFPHGILGAFIDATKVGPVFCSFLI